MIGTSVAKLLLGLSAVRTSLVCLECQATYFSYGSGALTRSRTSETPSRMAELAGDFGKLRLPLPKTFCGEPSDWEDWSWNFKSYLAPLPARFSRLLSTFRNFEHRDRRCTLHKCTSGRRGSSHENVF